MSLLDATLHEQAAAVAGGEADPAELLAAALSRIEDRNPSVNAIVETFPEQSRQMLAEAPNGPLRGVPVAIKDEWPLPWRARCGRPVVDSIVPVIGVLDTARRAGFAAPGSTPTHGSGCGVTA